MHPFVDLFCRRSRLLGRLVLSLLLVAGVAGAAVPPMPVAEVASGGRLEVSGTDADDHLGVWLKDGEIRVMDESRDQALARLPMHRTSLIVIRAGAGNDQVTVDPRLIEASRDRSSPFRIELHGGAGDDRLMAGSDIEIAALSRAQSTLDDLLRRAQDLVDRGRDIVQEAAVLAKAGYDDMVSPMERRRVEGMSVVETAFDELLDVLSDRVVESMELLDLLADGDADAVARRARVETAREAARPLLRRQSVGRELAGQELDRLQADQSRIEEILAQLEIESELQAEQLSGSASRALARRAEAWADGLEPPVERIDAGPLEALGEALEQAGLAEADAILRRSESLMSRADTLSVEAESLILELEAVLATLNRGEDPVKSTGTPDPSSLAKIADFDCSPDPIFQIFGDSGIDFLVGTGVSDFISGGPGTDYVFALAGDDEIDGGAGTDFLFGGGGRDLIHGRADTDLIVGEAGADCLFGDEGRDVMLGGGLFGDTGDAMRGGDDEDLMLGMQGEDRMEGEDGLDVMFGNGDGDRMEGGAGTTVTMPWGFDVELGNLMFGNRGEDRMLGGSGVDAMFGNRDEDHLSGDEQVDVMFGNRGNDTIEGELGGVLFQIQGVDVRLGNLLFGNQDEDDLRGGPDLDVAFGNRGDDRIVGGDGSSVFGGIDTDFLFGNEGGDTINGGRGIDFIFGNQGDDVLDGDDGSASQDLSSDLIFGNRGKDEIRGGRGIDLLFGNQDDDRIEGGTGWDLAFGNRGCDELLGDAGTDLLFGNRGVDMLDGGDGWDGVFGNRDHDTVRGGSGTDLVSGDRGCDVVEGGDNLDLLLGGADDDIAFGGRDTDLIFGITGDDALWGERGMDAVFGNRGNDCLNGGRDPDLVSGDQGSDDLTTGPGAIDLGLGGAGDDDLLGEGGTDILCGGPGNDRIDGGAGFDFLYGNGGFDRIWGGPGPDICRGEVEDGNGSSGLEVVCNRPAPRCIRGIKYHDLNGDGDRDSGEPTLPGWTVTIYRGEQYVGSGVTDSEGRWAVCGLPTGCYTAIEETRRCWAATTPERQEVMLSAVKDAEGVNFGNRMIEPCDLPGPCDCSEGLCVPEPEVVADQGCARSGSTNGSVTFSGISCGQGPYTCEGPPGTQVEAVPPAQCAFTGVGPGPQTFYISDAGGNTTTVEVTVEQKVTLLDTQVRQPTVFGACNDGGITLDVQSLSDTLTYRWSKNGQDIPTPQPPLSADGLGPGEYQILVTDEAGCFVAANVDLECEESPNPDDPDVIYYSFELEECQGWDEICPEPSALETIEPFNNGCGCGCVRSDGFERPLPRLQILGTFVGGSEVAVGDRLTTAPDEGTGWSLGIERGLSPRFSLELGAMELPGLDLVMREGDRVEQTSSELRLLYGALHWRPIFLRRWNLYVGPFVGVADLALPADLGASEDPAIGAVLGADFVFGASRRLTLSTSLRYVELALDVEDRRGGATGGPTVEQDLEPWVLGLGLGYRF